MIHSSNRFFPKALTAFLTLVIVSVCISPVGSQDVKLKPTFGSIELKAGFLPDPMTVNLVAGGNILTKLGGVSAYVANAPDYRLNYTPGKYPLTIHVKSSAATTLLINLPDETWVANDDGPNNGLNPLIEFKNPKAGQYDIWVGTVKQESPKAVLYITELGSSGANVKGKDN
jgi:hypothetical protein